MSVSGTLTGQRHVEKLVEVDGFDIEVALSDHMAVFRYDDRPGIVGTVGRILGEAGVNIAGMQVSRDRKGGHALVAMTVDGAIPTPVLDEIVAEIGGEPPPVRSTSPRTDRPRVRPGGGHSVPPSGTACQPARHPGRAPYREMTMTRLVLSYFASRGGAR